MYPTTDIELHPDSPLGAEFWTPQPRDIDDDEGFGYFQDVWPIVGVSVRDARTIAEQDKLLCQLVGQQAQNALEFDALATAVETGSADDVEGINPDQLAAIGPYPTDEVALDSLEVGVAGVVYGLSAAGMYPAASCRGHPGPHAWSSFPVVLFAADRPHAETLQPLVESSQRGFDIDSVRCDLLVIKSKSVENTLRLAGAVLDALPDFQSLRKG